MSPRPTLTSCLTVFALLAAGAAPLAPAARAQSVNEFHLPPGATRSPPPVGPEADPPAPRRTPEPAPSPQPTPVAIPTPPAAAPVVAPSPMATQRAAVPAAALPGPAPAAPVAKRRVPSAPAPAPDVEPTPADRSPAPAPVVFPSAASSTPAASPVPAASAGTTPSAPPAPTVGWGFWLTLIAALGAAAAVLMLRRGRAAVSAHDEPESAVRPVESSDRAAPSPPPGPAPAPATPAPGFRPAAAASPPAASPVAASPAAAAIELVPERMSISLLNATLRYRLRITNDSAVPQDVAAGLDMIAAHASLPEADQLGRADQPPTARHQASALPPGESIEWTGDLRLRLDQIHAIRQGSAALFVPLVRLRLAGAEPRALVIGETPAPGNDRLVPFRLDQGPRVFAAISARDVSAAA